MYLAQKLKVTNTLRTRYFYASTRPNTPSKLRTTRNEPAGVCYEVAGIVGCSSTRGTSTAARTHRATVTKGGEADLKTR